MDFVQEKKKRIDGIEQAIGIHLQTAYPETLYEAMRYSVLAGGKRLRPLLLLSVCDGVGGDMSHAMDFACALEFIHTYSLIHDDLPAMDDDDLRRGRPTCHKAYGEAIAILAGDALLNLAYEIMVAACERQMCLSDLRAMREIAGAAGAKGMVGGQTVDILSENKRIDESTLLYIHRHKTGALFTAAFTAGGLLGGADDATLARLRQAGALYGAAFQIRDDILDMTSTAEQLGKPVNSDEKNQKSTYVSVYGLQKSNDIYRDIAGQAMEAIADIGLQNDFLWRLAAHLTDRMQ